MTSAIFVLTFLLFLIIATLYSSVGHAGASGYLAIMALLSFAPETIKPISLVLNIVVAVIASVKFISAGYFDKKIFLSLIITAIPMAFLGGYITISPKYFKLAAGIFLVISAILQIIKVYIKTTTSIKPMPLYLGLIIGAVIGFISGLIGVGGGIFLSPIIIMANWTSVKKASGIAAAFILCNSVAGLAGHFTGAVLLGAVIGSYLGTMKFNNKIIITCLFLVLMTGLKFIFVDFAK